MTTNDLILVDQIEMHEFTIDEDENSEKPTGKTEKFNIYLIKEHLPLHLFKVGDDNESGNITIISGLTHFMFSDEIRNAKESDFLFSGSVTKTIGDDLFLYQSKAKEWRRILSKINT